MTAVACRAVSFAYNGARIVDAVSLSVAPGEWLGLIGPNGAGKTTLLRVVAGLAPDSGVVTLDGRPVTEMSGRARAQQIAVVPQNPVIPSAMSLLDYVLLGRTPYIGYWAAESADDVAAARRTLARVDLEHMGTRAMGSLSGGERQRAVLARALAQESPVLLMDEPTSALDLGHQQRVLDYVDALRHEHDLAVVSALHDLTLAAQYPDRLVMLDAGRVVADGVPDEVLTADLLARHYGASVSVLRDDAGGLIIAPRRT